MSITYTYHISQLYVDETDATPDGTVKSIKAYIRGIDENGHNTTHIFELDLPLEIDLDSFTPFENLTPEIVAGWIESILSGDEKKLLEDIVAEKIQSFYKVSSNKTDEVTVRPAVPWTVEVID